MDRSAQLSVLSEAFAAAEDRVLNFIDSVETDPKLTTVFGADLVGYALNDRMLDMESATRELIYKDPELGAEAFADYGDAVLLVSERIESRIPETGWVVDRHLGGYYAMGKLPVKDLSRSETPSLGI
jgi:hypothetical protein